MIEQVPPEHLGVPLLLEQTLPHALQLLTSVLRFASQPSAAEPLQLPKPELQVTEQV